VLRDREEARKQAEAAVNQDVVDTKSGRALRLEDPEPWPTPVDGELLLNDLKLLFEQFLIQPPCGRSRWRCGPY
jgi:hypothetical protein